MISLFTQDLNDLETRFRGTLINSLVGYKNLQLLGTRSEDGKLNLGLFNSVFHLGANPALLGFVLRPEGPEHDTLSNLKNTRNFTLNLVQEKFYQRAHDTSARYPSGVSEFEPCSFKEWFSEGGFGPYVEESPVRMGLEVKEFLPIKLNGTTIVIGEIKEIHFLDPEIIGKDGFVDLSKENIICCQGLDAYFLPEKLGRMSYAKPYYSSNVIP